jgi:hypothetical protein
LGQEQKSLKLAQEATFWAVAESKARGAVVEMLVSAMRKLVKQHHDMAAAYDDKLDALEEYLQCLLENSS